MNISGVYKIQSLIKPNRVYIGSASDIYHRWSQHLRNLRNSKHHSNKLQRHFNKYGKNDLKFSIVIGCDRADLINTEQFFIDSLKPYFNCSQKACTNGGFNHSVETRKKISNSLKGERHPLYGKHHSEETRKKISRSKIGIVVNLGRKHSDQTKKKISESKKGKPHPHIGNRPSDGGIRSIKEKLRGRIPWNKGKTNPHKGYIHTDEQKKKISESLLRYNELRRLKIISN